ncbi:MAG TPA: hypothetical protein VG370_33610 [Chloroflexota bacterium]|jgi:hypothetical protein|nr:hypothetical protein [Chloroflexota bacterium]
MSTTDATKTTTPGIPRVQPKPEPQPWRTPEDAEGWTVVARGRGKGKMPLISVEVDLDRPQSEWVRREAKRTGLGYTEVVKRLVEEARRAGARAKKRAS